MTVRTVTCPRCKQVVRANVSVNSTRVSCPSCQADFGVPAELPNRADVRWYVARGKQKLGPYTPGQLKNMVAAGELRTDDMLLPEGSSKWMTAGAVAGLFPPVATVVGRPAAQLEALIHQAGPEEQAAILPSRGARAPASKLPLPVILVTAGFMLFLLVSLIGIGACYLLLPPKPAASNLGDAAAHTTRTDPQRAEKELPRSTPRPTEKTPKLTPPKNEEPAEKAPKRSPPKDDEAPKLLDPVTEKSSKLLYQANLQYIGAFRVPNYYDANGEMSYGGTALAYNPARKSIFLVGHGNYSAQPIAEISIPRSIVKSSDLGDLSTATVLQPWTPVIPKLPDNLSGANDGSLIGGLAVHDGRLIGTLYAYYSGANDQATSHFALDSLELPKTEVHGLYRVGEVKARMVAGYMTPIPKEWQADLGAPFLTGQADIPILNTSSAGPAAFGFDPGKLGPKAAPAIPYVYYPNEKPLGPYVGPANPLQSGNTSVTGVAFMPGTSSVLFFGRTGTNYNGYGLAEEYGDPYDGGKGPHSLNGEYALQVWAYDANDFLAVKQGKLQPWQVQPYDVWNPTLPGLSGQQNLGGAAFDSTTGRLYVSVLGQDRKAERSSLPLIEVFQLHVNSPTEAARPHIGVLAVTSTLAAPKESTSPLLPGPVPAGKDVTLTAGNVYATSSGLKITAVKFYLNKAGGKLLGAGTPSKTPNADHNWILTTSTAGLSPGTYSVYAQAEDGDGQVSEPIAATLTIS